MEKFKTFSDHAVETGKPAEALNISFLSDFNNYMQESVRQSEHHNMKAISTASNIIINR